MIKYLYQAKRTPTELVSGEIEAQSQEEAASKLAEMGLIAVSISEKEAKQDHSDVLPSKVFCKPIKEGIFGVSNQTITIFIRQLSSLIGARVPILKTLNLLKEQTKNIAFKNIIEDIYQQVKEGQMLSQALACYPRYFDNFCLSLVSCGEKGGVLDKVLDNLAWHRQKAQDIRRRIQAALAYPLFIIATGCVTVFIMLTFFLPKLLRLFKDMKQALPWPTKVLMFISTAISDYWYWIIIALFFIIAIMIRLKDTLRERFFFDKIKFSIPLVKNMVMYGEIVKFTYTLSILLRYGLSIHKSLPLVNNVLSSTLLKKRLEKVTQDIIERGMSLSSSLQTIELFPPFVINMIAVGEEGGNLQDSLGQVASFYEKELDQAMRIFTSLLEPILILIVGAIVGFIVFAMLLPIFNIGAMT